MTALKRTVLLCGKCIAAWLERHRLLDPALNAIAEKARTTT